jgi:protease I
MWLLLSALELMRDRPIVCHTNLLGDVRNMGAVYFDQAVVLDGDLVTGRSAGHCVPFATEIIELLAEGRFTS